MAGKQVEAPPRYRVVGAYVTVLTAGMVGPAITGFYKDEFLPTDAPPETVARLLARGLIARFEEI